MALTAAAVDGPPGIGQGADALVGTDQRAAPGQRRRDRCQSLPVVLRHRLFQQHRPGAGCVEPVQERQHPLGAEAHVGIQDQPAVGGDLPHRQDPLQVQLLVPADLDLEGRESLFGELPRAARASSREPITMVMSVANESSGAFPAAGAKSRWNGIPRTREERSSRAISRAARPE